MNEVSRKESVHDTHAVHMSGPVFTAWTASRDSSFASFHVARVTPGPTQSWHRSYPHISHGLGRSPTLSISSRKRFNTQGARDFHGPWKCRGFHFQETLKCRGFWKLSHGFSGHSKKRNSQATGSCGWSLNGNGTKSVILRVISPNICLCRMPLYLQTAAPWTSYFLFLFSPLRALSASPWQN